MPANFVKLSEGFYLNLDLVVSIEGNEIRYADGAVFTLDDECLEALVSYLESHS